MSEDETTAKQLGQAYYYSLVAPSWPVLGTPWQMKSFLAVASLNSSNTDHSMQHMAEVLLK